MLAYVAAILAWVRGEVFGAPEPVALLALGMLFFALSLSGRSQRGRTSAINSATKQTSLGNGSQSALTTQESH